MVPKHISGATHEFCPIQHVPPKANFKVRLPDATRAKLAVEFTQMDQNLMLGKRQGFYGNNIIDLHRLCASEPRG